MLRLRDACLGRSLQCSARCPEARRACWTRFSRLPTTPLRCFRPAWSRANPVAEEITRLTKQLAGVAGAATGRWAARSFSVASFARGSIRSCSVSIADATASATILFLGANPATTTRLALDHEVRAITQQLRAAPEGRGFQLQQEWAVRVGALQEVLMEHRPAIVHFSGHGVPDDATGKSALVLEGENGAAAPVPPGALADLFRILSRDIDVRCVVLNACYSAAQAEALAEHVDAVIGLSAKIGDRAAIAFAGAFYRALGYGRSLQTAFDLGKNELDLQGLTGSEVLALTTRSGVDAGSIRLAAPRPAAATTYAILGFGSTGRRLKAKHVSRGDTVVTYDHAGRGADYVFLPKLFLEHRIAKAIDTTPGGLLRDFVPENVPYERADDSE